QPNETQGPSRGRYTVEEIDAAMARLKTCAEQDSSPHAMATCGCRTDLTLSKVTGPPDATAHCSEFADRFVATAKLPDEAQKAARFVPAATDVMPGSLMLFAFGAPCFSDANKAKSRELAAWCICQTHALANLMADVKPASQAELAATLTRTIDDLAGTSRCGLRPR
ncbi:MAG: hypothetical protein AB7O24_31275, partial [Kofleriaceae bacterium]